MLDDLKAITPQGKLLVPKLYKMHIYEKGGKFEKHKDTLHAANHYATLIITYPTTFKGGYFVLEVDGEPQSFCWENASESKYLIFLTDMPHEVKEVTEGTRVVLQYDVYLEDNPLANDEEELSPEEEDEDYSVCPYQKSVPEVLAEAGDHSMDPLVSLVDQFIQEHPNDSIVFLLNHDYARNVSLAHLKAGDRALYEALSAHYQIDLGSVVNHTSSDYEGGTDTETYKTLKVMDFNNKQRLMNYVKGNSDEGQEDSDGKVNVFLGGGGSFENTVSEGYIEYTGNEAQEGEYVYTSFVLAIGPKLQ